MKCNYCDKDKPGRMFNEIDLDDKKCKECKYKCEHKKRKRYCVDCNGSQICIHKKRKSHCVD